MSVRGRVHAPAGGDPALGHRMSPHTPRLCSGPCALALPLLWALALAACAPGGAGEGAPESVDDAAGAPTDRIDLVDLLLAFLQPDSVPQAFGDWQWWAQTGSPVGWETRGIEWSEEDQSYERVGTVILTLDGEAVPVLRQNVEPLRWGVRLFGPRAGPTGMEVNSGINAGELQPDIEARLQRRGVTSTVERCDGMGGVSSGTRLLRVEAAGWWPAWLQSWWSCGSAGCAIWLKLFLFPPEERELEELPSVDCAD